MTARSSNDDMHRLQLFRMLQRSWMLVVVVLEAVALAALCALWLASRQEASRLRERAAALSDYCRLVHAGMLADETELGDPARQKSASLRFYEPVANHSYGEILLCAKDPPDLSAHEKCLLANDYECLARLARRAADAISAGFE